MNQIKRHVPTGTVRLLTFDDFRSLQEQAEGLVPNGFQIDLSPAQRTSLRNLSTSAGPVGEGTHVRIAGYLAGNDDNPRANTGESVNCGLTKQANNDFHINLVENDGDTEFEGIVAEMIPQARPTEWNLPALRDVRSAGRRIMVSGQLFYDNVHAVRTDPDEDPAGNSPRFALWEIHPITTFKVCMRQANDCSPGVASQWKDLENVELTDLGGNRAETAIGNPPAAPEPSAQDRTWPVGDPTGAASPQLPLAESDYLPVRRTARNTFRFNHFALRGETPGPYVLSVKDSDYFQVEFIQTDPRKFNYTVSAITDERPKVANASVQTPGVRTDRLSTTAVSMRHNRLFTKYRVEIALREDLKSVSPNTTTGRGGLDKGGAGTPGGDASSPTETGYTLYSTAFDLWVETRPGWTVSFTGGVAFTNLASRPFFIKTDSKGTADTADDVKTVEADDSGRDEFRPDIIALVNVRDPERLKGVGMSFGVGLNNNADPRYFAGVSYLLGNNFVLNGGWTGGRVNVLPYGQELGHPPVNGDNTLTTLPTRFRHGVYVGIAFTFIDRKEQFIGAFAAAQKTTKDEESKNETKGKDTEETAKKNGAPIPAPDELKKFVGKFVDEKNIVAQVALPKGDLTLQIGNGPMLALTHLKDTTFQVTGNANSVVRFTVSTEGAVTKLEYHAPDSNFVGKPAGQ